MRTDILYIRAAAVSWAGGGNLRVWFYVPPSGGQSPVIPSVSVLLPIGVREEAHLDSNPAQIAQCPEERRHGCVVCLHVVFLSGC